ncbi:BTAD domain-containing putative transcriptional regulator [Nonomuraea roseoviolacea]|uniref:DNA-binding SARP family transcriptional activator n=1 Tax=Nonomuraea roseoviolacea subsp. carminata TaxID=160689 RepID=A0ABT1K1J4_9ACTN|nr:BTAD domain-containing putative transcriptional regulator [Nonomuraea roseoviolacea]MCP2347864.1 DNA-binding SARP family transcriptional activator [Nonomuraea roseoviolacea subsp. carminata]
MLIRLLGPVEVERAGRPRPVRPPQVALALAALAWEAGRVVPVESLLARVWGDQVPAGARHTLYTVITRIRREILGDDGAVVHRLGGYLLDVDESAVDVSRFRGLADQAMADPDPAPLLGEALALWRGDPLTGLPGEWAERARSRLRDERKEAALRWARLMTGRDAAAAVAALSPLADEYPLDELLAAALIEALHAWGRTAEALAHFARVRQTLAEELGVEPGTELRRVHRMLLLSGDAAETAGVVPAQLPVDLRFFVGRAAELDRLAAVATGDPPATAAICAISGPPGVGKSSLALHWAHLNRDRFPDGQLYADLSGVDAADAAVILPRFLGALGIPEAQMPSGVEARVGLYRSLLASRRILVVLDDAHGAEQVRPLLATAPGCMTLITSRAELSGLAVAEGASLVRLGVLPDDDAHRLLAARLGEPRLAAEPEATEQIIDRCGRLPLALAIVAAQLAGRADQSLPEVAADLARSGADLEPFAHSDPAIDLRTVFGRSYRDLPEPAIRLFRRLGRHPGPHLPLAAAASLAAVPVDRARELVARLERANLVDVRAPGRLRLHDLLRAYAAEQERAAESRSVRRGATRRLLDYYLHSACAASEVCYPHREKLDVRPRARGAVAERFAGRADALRWYADEVVALPGLLAEATGAGLDRHAYELAWAFAEFMQRRGPWEQILRVQAVALEAAGRAGDPLARARCHNSIARAHARLGGHKEAVEHFERAVDLHRSLDEPVLEAHVHLGLSASLTVVRPGEALDRLLGARDLFRRAGDVVGEARALNNAGWLRAQNGDHERALADCRRAQRILAEHGYAQGEAHAWDSIAYILQTMGEHAQAVVCYERAVELFRWCDDLYPAAETLVRLGEAHVAAGDTAAALDAWERAARCYDAVGDARARTVRDRVAAHGQHGAAVEKSLRNRSDL